MKGFKVLALILFVILLAPGRADAGGPFGPPQPIVKGTGGLHTGIGYWSHEDRYKHGAAEVIKQKQVYSEVGYGSQNGWEITARVGMADLKVIDAFSSANTSTVTSKNDFEEHGKIFTTVGAKVFYPFDNTCGMGAFVQGTYYFSDFTDTVSGTQAGAPFSLASRVKNLWDVNFGMGFQVAAPYGIKIYMGPYVYYSELKVAPAMSVTGVAFAAGEATMKNKTVWGGFTGFEVPLVKGFRLNLEGQYAEKLSAGSAVVYAY